MSRLAASLLVCLALAAGACQTTSSSSSSDAPKQASTYDGEGKPKIKFQDQSGGGGGGSSGGSSVLGWVAAPFENIVYLPWKLIGGGIKGAADGVGAGFGKDKTGGQRMPVLGVLFSPLNLVAGFL